MEDVLEVYQRPYDPKRPQVCIDETSKQLLEHTRIPIPPCPGTPARVDDEYKRCGTANIFLCVEPLEGKTVVKATEHRAKIDFAHFIRDLCDGPYRDAEKLVVVMDNLNTHSTASLYDLQFYRQKPLGNFVVDFYCPSARLVIEIDGGQHYTEEGQRQDSKRDALLNDMGLSVLRFSNLDVLGNLDGVMAEIVRHLVKEFGERETKSP